MHWMSTDNKSRFDWIVEKNFVLDGYPYSYTSNRTYKAEYPFPSTFTLSVFQGVSPCVDNTRWISFAVDPTLALLFTGGSLDDSPTKGSGKKVPVAAIVVPVVLILAAVAVIVLLVVFVPAVRFAVLPYRKRDAKRDKSQLSTQKGWSEGQKPLTHQ